MILIISSQSDGHATAVLEHLTERGGSATLLDLSQFPQAMQLSINFHDTDNHALLTQAGNELDFSSYKAIWWRRPQPFDLHAEIADSVNRTFAYTECYSAISGLWLMADAFWVNDPSRDELASRKVFQLKLAQEIGLEIPDTLITNDPKRAHAFLENRNPGKTIYKAFSGTEEAWRETRVLSADEVAVIDSVRFAPVIFQEYIPARCDLRVTVMGKDIFPAAIYAKDTSYEFDYRMDMDRARIEPFELPPQVIEHLHAFMKCLGLVYGAIDLRLTPDGRFVFLEINPSGQWRFIESRTGQPMTETFVNLLIEHDT